MQVTASSNRSLTSQAIGGSVSLSFAAGVGVAIANATGGPTACIGADAVIGQTGTVGLVNVAATSTDTVMAKAYGVAAGIDAGLTGVYASAESNPTVAASIGSSAAVTVTGNISVGAMSTGQATAKAVGVAVSGGLALGISVTNAQVSPDTTAEIGGSAVLQAGQGISVSALNNITSTGMPLPDGADSEADAGAGAIVFGGAGSDATSTASPTVDAGVASGASLTAGSTISIISQSHDHSVRRASARGSGSWASASVSRRRPTEARPALMLIRTSA